MSEGIASTSPPVCPAAADEATGGTSTDEQDGASNSREVRCSGCIVWNRQQTWLCVVPLLIGFIGLGLSLMLLKWIVVGSVKDYVPTDLVDAKGIGQDPIFLSKPSSYPKNPESTTTITSRTPNRISTRITTTTQSPKSISTARETTLLSSRAPTSHRIKSPLTPFTTTGLVTHPLPGTPTPHSMPLWPTATYATSSNKVYLHDSTPSWTIPHFQESTTTQDIMSTTPKFWSQGAGVYPGSHWAEGRETNPRKDTSLKHISLSDPSFHYQASTTYSTEHSEHFKPCRDKDLAYCLNDGECFVIETLTGSHKHCR
ncbi:pro-neuregulin-3, membrane-bound isoform [Protopterus annectens]|uniref:pro-neuregulin-3, membrane-bound isoform n=1 Tax=Protopterus annectens TaxID=7888 RepID=UPI001CFA794C|nr:pro-neuregulin-3, membrane-bound isoform [Protopterus annectens]